MAYNIYMRFQRWSENGLFGLSTNYLHGACLSEGERVDMKVFPTLWASGDWQDVNFVVADKGYDVYQVLKLIRDTGKAAYYSQASKCSF